MNMPTNNEIVDAELKELFEWIGTLNYDVNQAISKTSTPSPDEKDAIRIACKKIADKARTDQFRKDTDARMQSIKQARAVAIRYTIAYMGVAKSEMCLKDRAILLDEINLLEKELKKLEE